MQDITLGEVSLHPLKMYWSSLLGQGSGSTGQPVLLSRRWRCPYPQEDGLSRCHLSRIQDTDQEAHTQGELFVE